LTSSLASQDNQLEKKYAKEKGVLLFLLSKLAAYTLLGFLLGFLGSTLNISPKFQGWLQLFVGLYMLATAGQLLNLHPIFRYFVIQPPKGIFKLLKKGSSAKSFFAPIFLGSLTVLIPCGITQAMMLLSMGTGNPVWGATIMFAFILGTSPIFFMIGLATTELLKHNAFSIIAAGLIAVMGILTINSGQLLRGSTHTLQNYYRVLVGDNSAIERDIKINNGKQEVTIYIGGHGYRSDTHTLKVGVPVKLTLVSQNAQGCARAFTIPDLNFFKVLPANGTQIIEFTPKSVGSLIYTCSMGMYSGFFNVTE